MRFPLHPRALFLFAVPLLLPAQQQQQSQPQPAPPPEGFGDLFSRAPQHVEDALRARISTFYQLFQEKKYRKADELVHEDSKDIYFSGAKPFVRKHKILSIAYEENFTRARVTVEIDTDMMMPGFGNMAVPRPMSSFWKLDQNQWWWYVPEEYTKGAETAIERLKEGMGNSPGAGTLGTPDALRDFARVRDEIQNKISFDKTEILLPSGDPGDAEVTITNRFEAPVHLSVSMPEVLGLALHFDKNPVAPGESAKLKIASRPHAKGFKEGVTAMVSVAELGRNVPVQIRFTVPASSEPKPGTYVGPGNAKPQPK